MREGLRSSTLSQRRAKRKGNSRPVVKPIARRLTRQFEAETKGGGKLDGKVQPSLDSEAETESPDRSVFAENGSSGDNLQKTSEEDWVGLQQGNTSSVHEEVVGVMVDQKTKEGNGKVEINAEQAMSVKKGKSCSAVKPVIRRVTRRFSAENGQNSEEDMSCRYEEAASVIVDKARKEENRAKIIVQALLGMRVQCKPNIVHDDKSLELNVKGSDQDKVDCEAPPSLESESQDKSGINLQKNSEEDRMGLQQEGTSSVHEEAMIGMSDKKTNKRKAETKAEQALSVKKGKSCSAVKPGVRRVTRQFNAEKKSVTDTRVAELDDEIPLSLETVGKTTKSLDKSALAENGSSEDNLQKILEEDSLGSRQDNTSCGREEAASVMVDQETKDENDTVQTEQALPVIYVQNIFSDDKNLELIVKGSDQDKIDGEAPLSLESQSLDKSALADNGPSADNLAKNSEEDRLGLQQEITFSGEEEAGCVIIDRKTKEESNGIKAKQALSGMKGDWGCSVDPVFNRVTDSRAAELDSEVQSSLGSEIKTGSPDKLTLAENGPSEDNSQKNSEVDRLGLQLDNALSGHVVAGSMMVEQEAKEDNDTIEIEQTLSATKLECEENVEHDDKNFEQNLKSSDQDTRDGEAPATQESEWETESQDKFALAETGLQQESTLSGHEEARSVTVDQKTKEESDTIKVIQAQALSVMKLDQKIDHVDKKKELNVEGNDHVDPKIDHVDERKRMIDSSDKPTKTDDEQKNQSSEHPQKKHESDEGYGKQDKACDALTSTQNGEATAVLVVPREDNINESVGAGKKLKRGRGRPRKVREENNGLNSMPQSGEAVKKQAGNTLREGPKKLKRGRPRLKKYDEKQKYLVSKLQNGDRFDNGVKEIDSCEFNGLTVVPKKLKLDYEKPMKMEGVNVSPSSQNGDVFDNGVMEIKSDEFNRLTEDPKNLELDCERPINIDSTVDAVPNSMLQNEEGANRESSETKGALNSLLQNQEMVNKEAVEIASNKPKRRCVKNKNYNADDELDALLRKEEAAQRKAMRMMRWKKAAAQRMQKEEAAHRKSMARKGMLNCITQGREMGKRGRGRPRKVQKDADAQKMILQNEDAAGVAVNRNKDPRPKNWFKDRHARAQKDNMELEGMEVKEDMDQDVGQSVDSRAQKDKMGKNGQKLVIQKLEGMEMAVCGKVKEEEVDLDMEKDVWNAGGDSFISGSESSGKHNKLAGAKSLREQKQMIRDEIVEMLVSAGWRIEYRPREGRAYQDPVYVNPQGRTHWSVTLAYKKFKKQVDDGKIGRGPQSPNFFFNPIPEERLSLLFRKQQIKRRGKKAVLKKTENVMPNHKKTAVKSAEKSAEKSGAKSNKRKRKSLIASGQKKNPSSIQKNTQKNTQKRRKNALLVRGSGQAFNSSDDGLLSFSGKHSVLSWMIETGIVQLGERVSYCIRTKKVLEGNITRDGICCCCCEEIMSVTKFAEHTNRRQCQTYENLYLDNGLSLLQCQIDSWNKMEDPVRSGFHLIDVDGEDPNDDTCGLCGDGGDLVCCDSCPSTFHQSCLNIENFPSGEWQCVYCSCKYCGNVDGHVDEPGDANADQRQKYFNCTNSLHTCNLCDQKYHQTCMEAEDAVCIKSRAISFCGKSCEQISERLVDLFGVKEDIGDGYTCSLIKRKDITTDLSNPSQLAVVEQTSKLAVALGVMDECFLPIIDHRSGINLIRNTVYSCGSNFKRINFQGFFNAILEKDDELIAAATVRIHGKTLAEMPFIGTRIAYRRQGMCRRLLYGVESALRSLNIEKLVIPAVPVVLETWTKVFGFKPLDKCKGEMRHMNVMQFPFTDILQKPLLDSRYTAETTAPLPENGVQIEDSVSMDQVVGEKQNTVGRIDGDCPSDLCNGPGSQNPIGTLKHAHGDVEEEKASSNSSEELQADGTNVSTDRPFAFPESSSQQVDCSLADDVARQEEMEASSFLYASDSADSDHDMGGGMYGVSNADSALTRVNACKSKNDKLPGLIYSGEVATDPARPGSIEVENGQVVRNECGTSGDMMDGCSNEIQIQSNSFVESPKLDVVAGKSSGSTCEEDQSVPCIHDVRKKWEEESSRL